MSEEQDRRIVVKIGTSLLTSSNGRLDRTRIEFFAQMIAEAWSGGLEVILVTSGAIAAGFERLGYTERPSGMCARQACAAVGQGLLVEAYSQAFQRYSRTVAQLLLTRGDFTRRQSYNNALNTLNLLLEQGAVPIINENDTVSVREIAFGDNDILAALVAALLRANRLLLLTDIDGLYDGNPRTNPEAKPIRRVTQLTPEIMELAGAAGSRVGTGGMAAKLKAAQAALSMGVPVFVGQVSSADPGEIGRILAGSGAGTYFEVQRDSVLNRKKQWIAFHSEMNGRITVDAGAAKALVKQGRSLLPAGVVDAYGEFKQGAVVEIVDQEGTVLGKGIVNYDCAELLAVRGLSAEDARQRSSAGKPEVVHRDDWIALQDFVSA